MPIIFKENFHFEEKLIIYWGIWNVYKVLKLIDKIKTKQTKIKSRLEQFTTSDFIIVQI